jgi:hypothetical protein
MEPAVPKSRTSKAVVNETLSSGIDRADLGRLLGRKMRSLYEASLPTAPLPDDLARLIERLEASSKAPRAAGKL